MITGIRAVYLAQHIVDFRKRCSGLLGEAYKMQLDPYRGDCVVFVHRRQTHLRAIVGDEYGLYLIERRFDGGAVRLLESFMSEKAFVEITEAELALFLYGAQYYVQKLPKKWK